MNPGSHGELMDEHFSSFGKEHWSLSRDHLGGFDEKMLLASGQLQQKTTHFHILIQLHYLLYPGQWQFLVLEVRNGHISYFWGRQKVRRSLEKSIYRQ